MPTLPTVEKSSQSRAACTWCSRTRQILVSCSRVISATFDTGIALAKVNASASNSIVNPEPGRAHARADLPHPMLRAAHPRETGMQQRLVLKEVQVPPRLGRGVVHRTPAVSTVLGRTGEPGTTTELQIQIQPGLLRVELGPRHPPRRGQPQPPSFTGVDDMPRSLSACRHYSRIRVRGPLSGIGEIQSHRD